MQTRDLIENAYAAYAEGRLEDAMALFAEDACFIWNAQEGAAAFHGRCDSRTAFRETLVNLLADWEIHSYKCIDLIVEGDRAAARVAMTISNRATGRKVETQLGHFWTVRNGEAVELHEFLDTGAALAAAN